MKLRNLLLAVVLALNGAFANAQAITGQGVSNTCGLATPCGALIAGIQTSAGSSVPATDNTFDLGSTSKQYRSAYLGTSLVMSSLTGQLLMGVGALPADVGTGRLYVFGNSATARQVSFAQGSADAGGAFMDFFKSRATDGSADTIVQSGDQIAGITFKGANGTTFSNAARISVTVDGTPGASADMPGALDFLVSPDGSATVASALKLTNDKVATFGGAIKSTANSLGWVVRTGANTACSTTCGAGKGCVGGYDIGTTSLVDCAAATADSCFCSF